MKVSLRVPSPPSLLLRPYAVSFGAQGQRTAVPLSEKCLLLESQESKGGSDLVMCALNCFLAFGVVTLKPSNFRSKYRDCGARTLLPLSIGRVFGPVASDCIPTAEGTTEADLKLTGAAFGCISRVLGGTSSLNVSSIIVCSTLSLFVLARELHGRFICKAPCTVRSLMSSSRIVSTLIVWQDCELSSSAHTSRATVPLSFLRRRQTSAATASRERLSIDASFLSGVSLCRA